MCSGVNCITDFCCTRYSFPSTYSQTTVVSYLLLAGTWEMDDGRIPRLVALSNKKQSSFATSSKVRNDFSFVLLPTKVTVMVCQTKKRVDQGQTSEGLGC